MLRAALQACRPLAHANIAPALLYGQALAWATTGRFSWSGFVLAHAFGVLDHLFIVFTNDHADRHDDAQNRTFNLFSGGSRVLPEGRISPGSLRLAALGSGALLLGLCAASGRPHLLPLGLLAVALMLAYSGRPLRLSHRGGGEYLQAVGVGIVLPAVGFCAQSDALHALPWPALVPTSILALAGNLLTALPDAPADRAVGKRTWVVRRGDASSRREVLALHALGLALGVACMPFGTFIGRAVATAPSLAALLVSCRWLRDGTPGSTALLRFMVAVGASSTLALGAWSLGLLGSR